MSLIACSECGKQFSSLAKACPGCGAPAKASLPPGERQARKDKTTVVVAAAGALVVLLLLASAGGSEAVTLVVGGVMAVSLIWVLLLWPIYVGNQLGKQRGQPNIGAVIGFLAGWIGVFVYSRVVPPLAVVPDDPPIQTMSAKKQAAYEAWADGQKQTGQLR